MTMRRALLSLLLLLSLGLAAAVELPAQPPPLVGKVVAPQPRVRGGVPPRALEPLQRLSPVLRGMRVDTNRKGRAKIAIDTEVRDKPGTIILGPDTDVVFSDFVVGRAQGLQPEMGIRMAFGMLRIVLRPEGPAPQEGEYWIETPKGDRIRLLGTDAYVRLDRDGRLVVAVVEGKVAVDSVAGATVEVGPGEWTYVAPGRPPTPPAPFNRNPDDPSSGSRDEVIVVDPPEIGRLQLDLPK